MASVQEQANASVLSGEAKYGSLPPRAMGSPQVDPLPSSDIPPTTPDRMGLVRGFYTRLTNALTSVGITRYYLEMVTDQKSLFSFTGMEGQFFIDLSTDNTLRLIRTTPQDGGSLEEAFDLCADGRAQYNSHAFIVKERLDLKASQNSYISPGNEKDSENVINRLRALTEGLETSLASPTYSPHKIKQQVGALYEILTRDHLTPQGIIRAGEQKRSDDYRIYLPALGQVVLNFIRDEGKEGILITQARPDSIIKQWRLYRTGNASVLVFQQNTNSNPVWSGRIQIDEASGHDHSSNPYLTYLEFQKIAAQITSKAS